MPTGIKRNQIAGAKVRGIRTVAQLDRRLQVVRDFDRFKDAIISDLGGAENVSTIAQMQAENLATLMIKLSAWNADEIEGASIPIDDYQKIASLATRIAGQLGIDMKRIVKDVSLLDTFGKEVS